MNRSRCGNRGFDECRGRGSAASSRHPRAPAARPGPLKIVAAEPAGDVDAAPAPRMTTSKCSIALLKGPVIRRERLPAHSRAKPLDRRLGPRSEAATPRPIAFSLDRPTRSRPEGRQALLRLAYRMAPHGKDYAVVVTGAKVRASSGLMLWGWCGELTRIGVEGFPNQRFSELDREMPPPPDIDALSLSELKSLVLKLLEERAEFQRAIGALRDEIARLKGGPGRPDIKANVKPSLKPSGMEKASEARGGGPVRRAPSARLHANEVDDP